MNDRNTEADTTTFVAAREALLALIALAADRSDASTNADEVRLWAQRRDHWTAQWRALQPSDVTTQQHILTVDAELLRERRGQR